MEDWQISVVAFKPSGKWAYGGPTIEHDPNAPRILTEAHQNEFSNTLRGLIEENDPSVHQYSPTLGGFKDGYYYVIEIQFPAYVNDHCHFLLDKTDRLAGQRDPLDRLQSV